METLKSILGRRSIRDFQPKQITDEDINKILESVRWAPSAGNRQPWRFIVVKNLKIRRMIKTVSMGMRGDPPVIIVACLEKGRGPKVIEDTKYLDIGAAIQNLLITAHSLGLGACWIVSTNWSGIRSAIQLDQNYDLEPVSLISLGYPKDKVLPQRKRKTIQEIAFQDTVGKKWEKRS